LAFWTITVAKLERLRDDLAPVKSGSCSSLSWHLVSVSVPALVGLPGVVLAAAPQRPAVAVVLVATGVGNDGVLRVSSSMAIYLMHGSKSATLTADTPCLVGTTQTMD
jgi:hypothetical protein